VCPLVQVGAGWSASPRRRRVHQLRLRERRFQREVSAERGGARDGCMRASDHKSSCEPSASTSSEPRQARSGPAPLRPGGRQHSGCGQRRQEEQATYPTTESPSPSLLRWYSGQLRSAPAPETTAALSLPTNAGALDRGGKENTAAAAGEEDTDRHQWEAVWRARLAEIASAARKPASQSLSQHSLEEKGIEVLAFR